LLAVVRGQNALAAAVRGHSMVARDPVEAAGRNQHHADAVIERELQRLRNAVLCCLTNRLETESITVERK
jgi:hypothetical protein